MPYFINPDKSDPSKPQRQAAVLRFAFVGYLPTDASQRAQRIRDLELLSRKAHQTQLVIETPYRKVRRTVAWDAAATAADVGI